MKALAQNTLIQNRYLIVHLIGKGGMGEVYLAVDQRLGSAVALKRTYFAGDEMLGNAFEREARILARMRHPVLPKVSDHFTENEEQYLVMEHISGEDLAKRLDAAKKPFPLSWVMFWADQLLDALSYLHSHEPPIIHRDIKPQNLKLTDENHIILLDFGLSKSSTGQTHISASGSTGSVVGYTPHYAPMEQIRGIGTDARSDLYSLSATLYQLLTNQVPADALSRADAMLGGASDPIEPPHMLNPEVPKSVSDVLLKGMEVSQDKRFATAREMQKALRRAFTKIQETIAAQPVAFGAGSPLEQPHSSSLPEFVDDSDSISIPTNVVGAPIDLDATLAIDSLAGKRAGLSETNEISGAEDRAAETRTNGSIEVQSGSSGELSPVAPPPEDLGFRQDVPAHDSYATVMAGSNAAAAGNGVKDPVQAAPVQKKSKAGSIIGGLIAVLVLGLGAAGAGWYVYNNYGFNNAATEASPSPEATVEQSPEILTEAPIDPNANVAPAEGVVEASPEALPANSQDTASPGQASGDRATPRQGATGGRTTQNARQPKPTPSPRSRDDRTIILQ